MYNSFIGWISVQPDGGSRNGSSENLGNDTQFEYRITKEEQ